MTRVACVRSHRRARINRAIRGFALSLCVFTSAPGAASAGRPPTATPVVPDAAPAVSYDPALIAAIGATYGRYRFDLSHAFAHANAPAPAASPTATEVRRLRLRFSNAVDDAVTARVVAALSGNDGARAAQLQTLLANNHFLAHATETIRIFGLHETDFGDVVSALIIAGYDATHPVALTPAQCLGAAQAVRTALLASPLLPALNDVTKQTMASEMSYQLLFWEFDASLFENGQKPAAFAQLHASIATSLATLGISLDAIRPTDSGIELIAPPARR